MSFNNVLFFIFVFLVGMLFIYLDMLKKKADFRASLEKKDREERWRLEYEQEKHPKELKKVRKDIVPIWTVQLIQSLDSKVFVKLVAGYFESKDFLVKYSSHDNMMDVLFLCKSNGVIPYPVVKCRAIGSDLVSLETVKNFYNLSKQYVLTNIIFVTTGKFSSEVSTLLKNRKGFNLIDVNRFISLLMMLPIEKQVDLFAILESN